MKNIILSALAFLLLPFVLHANQNEQIENLKNQTVTIMEGTLPILKDARTCFDNANNKSQAEKCEKEMSKKSDDLMRKIGLGDMIESDDEDYDEDYEWDEQTKKEMLTELDKSIEDLKNTSECLKKYNSNEAFEKCEMFIK